MSISSSEDAARLDGHRVGFYETDGFLTDVVIDFLAPDVDGPGALIVATSEHREQFSSALRALGMDPVGLAAEGRIVMLDAARTLDCLLVDGAVDRERFRVTIGHALDGVAGDGLHVRVFGEMVALLWDRGEGAAAVALEDLWNEFLTTRDLRLLCAYPMRDFCGPQSDGDFQSICHRHTAVTNEGYLWLGGADGGPAIVTLERERDGGPVAGACAGD